MDTIVDDAYMKKHLREYILFQLNQGYAAIDIKNALQQFGYKKQLIKELFSQIGEQPITKKSKMYQSHDLTDELQIYVQSLLIDYIVKEQKIGYTSAAIRKALMNFGHDPALIHEAFQIIEQGNVVDYRQESAPAKLPQRIVSLLTLFLIFVFLVFLSMSTDTSIFTILPNFIPLFLAFILVNIAFFYLQNRKICAALPLFAVLITVGAFIAGTQYGIVGVAPGSTTILILNAIIVCISSGLVCAFSKKEKEAVIITDGKDIKNKKEIKEKNIDEKIRVPKLTAPIPKEQYHPPKKQPEKHSMLQYLRHEIDKPRSISRAHLHDVSTLPPKEKRKERLQIKEMPE